MKPFTRAAAIAAPVLLLAIAPAAFADVLTIGAIKDNTLFESEPGNISDGSGPHLYVGRGGLAAGGAIRRGLIAFDFSALPAGATISAVELTVNVSRKAPGSAPETIGLHRVTRNWGAGASDSGSPGGFGAPALVGDATWTTPFFGAAVPIDWTTDGGDFVVLASGARAVDDFGKYTFPSTAQLVADTQAWFNNPATNFGWLLKGDESQQSTARRIDSADNFDPSARPSLTITFVVPEPAALPLLVASAFLARRRQRPHPSTGAAKLKL